MSVGEAERIGIWAHRPDRRIEDAAVRRPGIVRPAAATRPGAQGRRRRRRRAVRLRRVLPARRPVRPHDVREASRLLRPYNPALDVSPFEIAQVADAGDIAVNPFNIDEAIETIEAAALELTARRNAAW